MPAQFGINANAHGGNATYVGNDGTVTRTGPKMMQTFNGTPAAGTTPMFNPSGPSGNVFGTTTANAPMRMAPSPLMTGGGNAGSAPNLTRPPSRPMLPSPTWDDNQDWFGAPGIAGLVGMAGGGSVHGPGMVLVGENGPELLVNESGTAHVVPMKSRSAPSISGGEGMSPSPSPSFPSSPPAPSPSIQPTARPGPTVQPSYPMAQSRNIAPEPSFPSLSNGLDSSPMMSAPTNVTATRSYRPRIPISAAPNLSGAAGDYLPPGYKAPTPSFVDASNRTQEAADYRRSRTENFARSLDATRAEKQVARQKAGAFAAGKTAGLSDDDARRHAYLLEHGQPGLLEAQQPTGAGAGGGESQASSGFESVDPKSFEKYHSGVMAQSLTEWRAANAHGGNRKDAAEARRKYQESRDALNDFRKWKMNGSQSTPRSSTTQPAGGEQAEPSYPLVPRPNRQQALQPGVDYIPKDQQPLTEPAARAMLDTILHQNPDAPQAELGSLFEQKLGEWGHGRETANNLLRKWFGEGGGAAHEDIRNIQTQFPRATGTRPARPMANVAPDRQRNLGGIVTMPGGQVVTVDPTGRSNGNPIARAAPLADETTYEMGPQRGATPLRRRSPATAPATQAGGISEEKIQHTMQKYGISREELMQRIGR